MKGLILSCLFVALASCGHKSGQTFTSQYEVGDTVRLLNSQFAGRVLDRRKGEDLVTYTSLCGIQTEWISETILSKVTWKGK